MPTLYTPTHPDGRRRRSREFLTVAMLSVFCEPDFEQWTFPMSERTETDDALDSIVGLCREDARRAQG